MAEWILFTIINQIITLTLVKFVLLKNPAAAAAAPKRETVSWHSALESMSTMETRIEQLTARDLRQQEQVWKLQDINRDLQEKTMRLTKEILSKTQNDVRDDEDGEYGDESR